MVSCGPTVRSNNFGPRSARLSCISIDSVPAEVELKGLLHCRRSEQQLELTLVGTGAAEVAVWAQQAGTERFDFVEMNLEDQFIEFTTPPHRRRLFQWEEA